MMLYVDGSDVEKLVLGWCSKTADGFAWEKEPAEFLCSPEEYLRVIDAFVRQSETVIEHIEGILLASGAGSSTALRASHALVNTLAFVRGIPLYRVRKAGGISATALIEHTDEQSSEILFPEYAKGAHITTSKKDALRR